MTPQGQGASPNPGARDSSNLEPCGTIPDTEAARVNRPRLLWLLAVGLAGTALAVWLPAALVSVEEEVRYEGRFVVRCSKGACIRTPMTDAEAQVARQAVARWIEALRSPDSGTRWEAAGKLRLLGSAAADLAVPALRQAQEDGDRSVRQAASSALRHVESIAEGERRDPHPPLRGGYPGATRADTSPPGKHPHERRLDN
jgi:hypothetical protein